MISNEQYLIQRYAEAREKRRRFTCNTSKSYWMGVMDTYHAILNEAFPGWDNPGSPGYYVIRENRSYDEALTNLTK